MSKVNCPCGNQMSDVSFPSNVTGYLIRSLDIDDAHVLDHIPRRDIWECHECGRIAVEMDRQGFL